MVINSFAGHSLDDKISLSLFRKRFSLFRQALVEAQVRIRKEFEKTKQHGRIEKTKTLQKL